MSKSLKSKPATAAEVRAFAAEQGITTGKRGLLSKSLIADFRKATGRTYTEGQAKVVEVTVSYTQPSGRKAKTVEFVSDAEARAIARGAGVEVGKRGPLSKAAMAAVAVAKGEARSVVKPVDATPKA